MVVFNIVAGTCGIIAFLVLTLQGARLLRVGHHIWLVRDPVRSLARAKHACEARHLDYKQLTGTAPRGRGHGEGVQGPRGAGAGRA
jgi:hypothetical protein